MNAGALVVADVVLSNFDDSGQALLDFMRRRSGNPEVGSDIVVARSDRESGYRNMAMANFIKSYGNLENDADAVLDLYCLPCSLRMDCVGLARSVQSLDRKGTPQNSSH